MFPISQTENLELIQSIKSRLVLENVIYYLAGTHFTQNIVLATACCSYTAFYKYLKLREAQKKLPKDL